MLQTTKELACILLVHPSKYASLYHLLLWYITSALSFVELDVELMYSWISLVKTNASVRRAGLVQAVESYRLWPEGPRFESWSPRIAQARVRLATDTLPQTPHRAGALCTGYALFKTNASVREHETCSFLPPPDDSLALDIAYTIYLKFGDLASALRIALKLEKVSTWLSNVTWYTALF